MRVDVRHQDEGARIHVRHSSLGIRRTHVAQRFSGGRVGKPGHHHSASITRVRDNVRRMLRDARRRCCYLITKHLNHLRLEVATD